MDSVNFCVRSTHVPSSYEAAPARNQARSQRVAQYLPPYLAYELPSGIAVEFHSKDIDKQYVINIC